MPSIQRTCSIENCDKRHDARGYCRDHYKAYIRYGDPLYPVIHRSAHGLTHHYIFNGWNNIKSRVFRSNSKHYGRYGGRGITMCDRWRYSAKDFFADLGDRPTPLHTLDRINNDGHYSCGKCEQCIMNSWPMNLRWATRQVQSWNRNRVSNNTSGYIGVCRARGKWLARYTDKAVILHLGYFDIPEEAAIAYDKAAIFFRGEEAKTNFL